MWENPRARFLTPALPNTNVTDSNEQSYAISLVEKESFIDEKFCIGEEAAEEKTFEEILRTYKETKEWDMSVVEGLAKTLYGEANSCSLLQKAAVIWCILNRVDVNGDGYIMGVITYPGQFHGYKTGNPVTEENLEIAKDVLARWELEKAGYSDVGRVLPGDYRWFGGNGVTNEFRNAYIGGTVWNWSLPNPYEK